MNDAYLANLLGTFALALTDAQMTAAREQSGLGTSACAAVVTIGQNSGLVITDLCKILGISHSVTVRLVEELVTKGWVTRLGSFDKRKVALQLTDQGYVLQLSIFNARNKVVANVLASMPDLKQKRLMNAVEGMLDNLTTGRTEAEYICRFCDASACAIETCPVELKALKLEAAR